MKRESIKQTRQRLRNHAIGMAAAKDGSPQAYQWHKQEYDRLRAIVIAHDLQVARKRPSLEVEKARNARWAHYGSIGSLHFARSVVRSIRHRITGEEAEGRSIRIEQDLEYLIEVLKKKGTPSGNHL